MTITPHLLPANPHSRLLIAVSGGTDSMALLHLLAREAEPGRLFAATVDHGLRLESSDEAEWVAEQAARLNVPHAILTWEHTSPFKEPAALTRIQERAREARYGLLVDHAKAIGATHLLTAHTLDDQAETILMRLMAGSGLEGLGGMREEVVRDGIIHVRPLLHVTKGELVALCEREGWSFVTDPSNMDRRFLRVRMRSLMPLLREEGLTAERLSILGKRMRRDGEALRHAAFEAFTACCVTSDPALQLAAGRWVALPEALRVRVLGLALEQVRPDGAKAIRLERLEGLERALSQAVTDNRHVRHTGGGVVSAYQEGGWLIFAPEGPRRRGKTSTISA